MADLVYDVQRYYRTVSEFMDSELADRGDGDLWRTIQGRILEIGCGSGRVAAQLAEGGNSVVGIDLSPELLELARSRLAGKGNVWLVIADMRQLGLRATFDAIVAPDDPFSHLIADEDRQRALGEVVAHLAPGGRFVLDALWFSPEDQRRVTAQGGSDRSRKVIHAGKSLHVREHWQCDSRTHICSVEFDYESGTRAAKARFDARYWTPSELRDRLACAGLEISGWWGGYLREPWDEQRSQHLIVEAQARLQP